MGFESGAYARRMMAALKERLAKFGLALHEDRTRLIEFGRLISLVAGGPGMAGSSSSTRHRANVCRGS